MFFYCFLVSVLLPTIASQRSAAASAKLKLSSDSCSDQIAMLRAFQGWQRAKREGKEKTYCGKNYISAGIVALNSIYVLLQGTRKSFDVQNDGKLFMRLY